jgi:hypothetical protein
MKREAILFLCHSNPEAIVDLIENLVDHIADFPQISDYYPNLTESNILYYVIRFFTSFFCSFTDSGPKSSDFWIYRLKH